MKPEVVLVAEGVLAAQTRRVTAWILGVVFVTCTSIALVIAGQLGWAAAAAASVVATSAFLVLRYGKDSSALRAQKVLMMWHAPRVDTSLARRVRSSAEADAAFGDGPQRARWKELERIAGQGRG